MIETQMTGVATSPTGASIASQSDWNSIDWTTRKKLVRRLQVRIAKATREGKTSRAKALQHLLTHSFSAKLLAVKRITQSSGNKTPGVDGVMWQTSDDKMAAAKSLRKRAYRAQPLRRVNIPKKNGKTRPLGIPVMKDRAMQALHLLALEPISETVADNNSYGFRPKRAAIDAIEQCFKATAKRNSAQWILEGDIKACFDKIDHQWLVDNIPMDKSILRQWLKAGYFHKSVFHKTDEGTPQGGTISPTLANMVLDGMERSVRSVVTKKDKCNFVRYADDFIITGTSKQVLEEKVKPAIEKFISERGLQLSGEKTLITHIDKGFDFLGFNVRKYKGKLLIKPSKKSINALLDKIHEIIFANKTTTSGKLIELLNPVLRGWCNYYRNVVSKQTFSRMDHIIFKMLWRWCRRRHPNKSAHFRKEKYFRRVGFRNWMFFGIIRKPDKTMKIVYLKAAGRTVIRRHTKIRAAANSFDPEYFQYFEDRKKSAQGKRKTIREAEKLWSSDSKPQGVLGQLSGL